MLSFLKNKVDVDLKFNGETVLKMATEKGDFDTVKLMIENSAKETEGVVCIAVKKRNSKLLKFLLKNEVECLSKYENWNCLHYACMKNDTRTLSLLIPLCGSLVNQTGKTPIFNAISDAKSLDMVRILVEHKADVNVLDNQRCKDFFFFISFFHN